MTKLFLYFLAVPALCLLLQCAQVGPLTGGKTDTAPPQLIAAIPANESTNFSTDVITLNFNEYIQLKELNNQLIVCPRLNTTPEVTTEGRSLKIALKKEELLPNTTYRFYFGSSVADLNESNSIPDFEYVFSTGDYLDTLQMTGTIADVATDKPAGKVLVGLYSRDKTDSVPFKEPPDYFTRSDENGKFIFRNLPEKEFRVFAIADQNKNNLYDGEPEKVGFGEENMRLSKDTNIRLRIFREEPSRTFIKKTVTPYYGLIQFVLNKKAQVIVSPIALRDKSDIYQSNEGMEKDTISIYYKNIEDTLRLRINYADKVKPDTLVTALPKNNVGRRKLRSYRTNVPNNTLALNTPVLVMFNTWMDTSGFSKEKITLSTRADSTSEVVPFSGHWRTITVFEIGAKFTGGNNYSLRLDTGAFHDINGYSNDSSLIKFRAEGVNDFGKVTLKILFDQKGDYIIQLIGQGDLVVREQPLSLSLSGSNAATIDFTTVPPGMYHVKIIYDDNGNKKWDTGKLIGRQRAETVLINSKQVKVLADWETEEEISIKEP
jgi:uncharacterized protein (DUF2141 family)